jgi:hypothetical protein
LYRWLFLCVLGTLLALPAHGQESSGNCRASPLDLNGDTSDTTAEAPRTKQPAVTNARPAVAVSPDTRAERRVQKVIETDGLHVVHFWAPWCSNSKNELADGWAGLVADNPNVTFTFVTVWNDNEDGADVLAKHNLPERVTELTQPDLGPSDTEANRRHSFLTHPVTWIPSTWIFHNNGELAFAMNYGEMDMRTIQSLLDATRKDW